MIKFVQLRIFIFAIFICIFGVLKAQPSIFRADVTLGHARFLGVDMKAMKNNMSWAVGVMTGDNQTGTLKEYRRIEYGIRIRHLQGEIDHYFNDSLGQLKRGFEQYRYNYLEIPISAEFDLLSAAGRTVSAGPSFGAFGAVPFGVKGERNYLGANPWSRAYERPYFILGFQLGGYIAVNIKKVGFRCHYSGQFPFIPIHNVPPSSYTGQPYKVQLLGMTGLMFSLDYCLSCKK
jgi:hypothetical protein